MKVIRDDRPWGHFLLFPNNCKILVVKPGQSLSLQLHHQRDEYWYVLKGQAFVTLGETNQILQEGDDIFIPREIKHRLRAVENEVHIYEIPYGIFDEEDIVRFEDIYGRV